MRFRITAALAATIASTTVMATPSQAQEMYLGQIIEVGFNFCPRGTMTADGAILNIASNTALFSLYGTTYGGDGRGTFALPDLRTQQKGNPKNWDDTTRKCVVTAGIFPSRT